MNRHEHAAFVAKMDAHMAPMRPAPMDDVHAELMALPPTESTLEALERALDHMPLTEGQASALWLRMAGVAAFLDYSEVE